MLGLTNIHVANDATKRTNIWRWIVIKLLEAHCLVYKGFNMVVVKNTKKTYFLLDSLEERRKLNITSKLGSCYMTQKKFEGINLWSFGLHGKSYIRAMRGSLKHSIRPSFSNERAYSLIIG
jgi:hypothetical protein